MDNQYGKNYENAKKWVANLKNSYQPLTISGNKAISQAQCLKLLRALALKELEDIAQQDREEKLRNREQNISLEKRKSSQRQDLREPIEEEEELEVIRIKQIKKNEIIISSNSNENTNTIIEDEDDSSNQKGQYSKQFLVQHNTIGIKFFDDCFKSSLLNLMYNNFSQPSEDLAKLFHALEKIEDIFLHLEKIHTNQAVMISGGGKHTFEECFRYVVENILLTKDEFINEIIKKSQRLEEFINKTKVQSEHLYILLSRVIQHEYRQNVQLFQEEKFSPLLQIFTNICSNSTKENLRVAFPHYIKINNRNSLIKKAVMVFEKSISGENYLKEAFKEKLYLLKNQGLDANESDHISSFLVYMVFRIKELFEDLFESFQQYNQCVQQQIMERVSNTNNTRKFKDYLRDQIKTDSQPPFLQMVLSVFEFNNSYLLQVFMFDVVTQFIDADEKQRILDLILGHISQTPHILDFYSRFPQYFQESLIADYKNLKDLQAPTCADFKTKFAFIPEDKVSSIHLLLLRRFLLEDSWFITKENIGEFITYFTQKIGLDVLLSFLQAFITEECLNLNNIVCLLLLKIASIVFSEENEKQINIIQQIIYELAQTRIWLNNQSFGTALVIFLQDICSKQERDILMSKLMAYFGTIPQGSEVKEAFSSLFQSQNAAEFVDGIQN